MSDHSGFIAAGFRAVGEGLADLCFIAGLDRKAVTLTGRMYARVRRGLLFFETLVRRLLILMAAGLDLPPVRRAAPAGVLPWGSGREKAPPSPRGFALVKPESYRSGFEDALAAYAGQRRAPETGLLLDRYRTLLGLLKDPSLHARRMARYLERLRAARLPRPLCFAMSGLHRVNAELALVAGPLPGLVNRALSGWKGRGWWDSG